MKDQQEKVEESFGQPVLRFKKDPDKKTQIIIEIIFNLSRRMSVATIIIYMNEITWLQLLLCMYINQAYLMYMVFNRLYECKKDNTIEILNEIIVLLTVYHLFCFSDFV